MLDVDIIDPHQHLWDLSMSYPWLERPADPERFSGDLTPITKNYLPSHYRHDFKPLKLVGSVHVDAGAGNSLLEVEWLKGLHDSEGLPSVVVAGADLLSDDAPMLLEQLANVSIVRGIRYNLNWHPDPNYTYTDRDDIIVDPVWRKNFARLESLGLSFDLQIYPSQLSNAVDLVTDFPGTSFILNHTGMPFSSSGEEFNEWLVGMKQLAARPNVSLKISGLGMMDRRWTADSIRPYVLESIETFSVERAMFGSNFPVDRLYSDIPTLYGAFDELTQAFSDDERRALFGRTAGNVYRIPIAI